MAQQPLQRATVSDVALTELLRGWTMAGTPPPDDRIVLIVRTSPIGSQLLLRDLGYYDHIEGEWLTVHGNPMHPVRAWHPYPELPDWEAL